MKKVLLSSFVILTYILYSLHERSQVVSSLPTTSKTIHISAASPSPSVPPPTDTPLPTTAPLTPTNVPTVPIIPTSTPKPTSLYKDGTYTGDVADAFYGNIQVQTTIANGRITDISFLQYPNDRSRSIDINQQADPILAQEAISAQSARVDIVSGATDSSQAFIQSMQSTLDKAKS